MKYGVVDVGSNTVRLAVYEKTGGSVLRLLDLQQTVGLAGYVEGGALTPGGILAATEALAAYRDLAASLGVATLRIFATASLRNISNTAPCVAALREATGLEVEVLTGAEEARLSFLGTLGESHLTDGLLVDIGGGSTELVPFIQREMTGGYSLPFGSLSLFKGQVAGLLPTRAEGAAITALVEAQLRAARCSTTPSPALLGTGGTIQGVGRLKRQVLGGSEHSFTRSQAQALLDSLVDGGRAALHTLLGAAPERVHTLVPGLLVLCAVMEVYGAEQVTLSDSDIRDGYLWERILPV